MKIEVIPASIPTYSRKTRLKTVTENAVDLDPEKSKSNQESPENRQNAKQQSDGENDLSHPHPTAVVTDPTRVHIVA